MAGIAALIVAVLFSLSRGGTLSMLLVFGVFACWLLSRRDTRFQVMHLTVPALLALGLLVWFGLELIGERFGSVELSREGRWEVWSSAISLARRFPLFGSGYGSFPFVEPIVRSGASTPDAFWDFAHNDFLQVLVEGGLLQFGLLGVAIFSVARSARLQILTSTSVAEKAQSVGVVAALSSAALHSMLDFSMHVPANALLVLYIAALAGQEYRTRREDTSENRSTTESSTATGLLKRGTMAFAAVALAWVLTTQSQSWEKAERYRLAALRDPNGGDPHFTARLLAVAVAQTPRDAGLRLAYADALASSFERELPPGRRSIDSQEFDQEILRQVVHARDLCPLDSQAHLRLAQYAEQFAQADPRHVYLERAVLLKRFDPTHWYVSGLAQLELGNVDAARIAWQESLSRSPRHLDPILDRIAEHLSDREILDNLLPRQGEQIYRAAERLFHSDDEVNRRRLFHEAALAALSQQTTRTADDDFLQAELLVSLQRPSESFDYYVAAIYAQPERLDWRLRFAEVLLAEGAFQQADRQLTAILTQRPGYPPAESLRKQLARNVAEDRVQRVRDQSPDLPAAGP